MLVAAWVGDSCNLHEREANPRILGIAPPKPSELRERIRWLYTDASTLPFSLLRGGTLGFPRKSYNHTLRERLNYTQGKSTF